MYLTQKVKCRCGHIHNLVGLTEEHDGKTVTCEQCGRTYRVGVQIMVHLMDEKGKFLKHHDG